MNDLKTNDENPQVNKTESSVINSEIQEKIFNALKSNIDKELIATLNYESTLKDVGIDSLKFMEIVLILEETFDIEFDDEMLLSISFPTIQSVFDYVKIKVKK